MESFRENMYEILLKENPENCSRKMENITIYCMNHSKHEIEFQFKGVPSLVAGMFFIQVIILGKKT